MDENSILNDRIILLNNVTIKNLKDYKVQDNNGSHRK